jgi:uncharacterized protein YjiS (DUF1127 family)
MRVTHRTTQKPFSGSQAAVSQILKVSAAPVRFLSGAFTIVKRYVECRQRRRELLSLSDSVLKDIGVSRYDVIREYKKPCWSKSVRR